jgi:glycine cleavage system aminomethyltransferase T
VLEDITERNLQVSEAPTAQSPLTHLYAANAQEVEIRNGWSIPTHFGSADVEVEAARSAVAVGELFGGATLDLVGEELVRCASRLGVGEVGIGTAAPVTLGEASGARWLRLTRSHARILLGSGAVGAARAVLETEGACLHVTDISSGLMTLVVIGPRSSDLLARLMRLDLDPRTFTDHSVALTGAVGIPLQVLRWDRGPLLTYELTVGRDVAEYFWDTLWHSGEGLGLKLIGQEALSQCSGPSGTTPEHLNI